MASIKKSKFKNQDENLFGKIFNLEDRIAIVTGGNGQLGTEYVKTLAEAGAKVAVFDLGTKLNPELGALQKKYQVKFFPADITKKELIEKAVTALAKEWGVPDILINNAALDAPPGSRAEAHRSFENYPLENWQSVLDVNLTGMFLCCQVIGGRMAEKGRGSIINISSTYGNVSPNQSIYAYQEKKGTPFVKPISYSATKSAVLNLTRYLATYWAKKGVRVNTLSPGGVFNNQDVEFVKNYSALTPMGRMARPGEYNGAILFLASNASSYMTGANLVIDGGWTAW